MNTVKTEKGTVLPLTNLKGKDYLMVAYRLQWFNEKVDNFEIETQFLHLDDTQTVARATVTVMDKDGKVVKKATATKRETKSDFTDHTEKAETSAIGRAVALLGYGTQFALADLDEGERLADSPLTNTKAATSKPAPTPSTTTVANSTSTTVPERKSSFRKTKISDNGNNHDVPKTETEKTKSSSDGWE